jgi:hypothetical protein
MLRIGLLCMMGFAVLSSPVFCLAQTTGGGGPGEEEAPYCYVLGLRDCMSIVTYLIDEEDEPIMYTCGGCQANEQNEQVCLRAGDKAVYPDFGTQISWATRGPDVPDGPYAGNEEFEEDETAQFCGTVEECGNGCELLGDTYYCETSFVKDYELKPRTPTGEGCWTTIF